MKKFQLLIIGVVIFSLTSFASVVVWADAESNYTQILNESYTIYAPGDNELGYTVGDSVISYGLGDISNPNLTYEEMKETSICRTAVWLKDGIPVGEVGFEFYEGVGWKPTFWIQSGSRLQDAIDCYGTDWLKIGSLDRHVWLMVTQDEPHWVIPLDDACKLDVYTLTEETDFDQSIATLSDYTIYASYANVVYYEEVMSGVLNGNHLEFNADALAAAKQYWAEHPQHNFAYGWVIAAIVVVAGAAVAFVCCRRKNTNKQHKN